MSIDFLADRIDALLPQTQCTKCGYDGCRPYAQAIADGEAINRCPPGGDEGIHALARLLGRPVLALDDTRGHPGPLTLAVIDESHCIGCTLCIAACPVDAIVGAAKRMHTVLDDACTGCDLCVAPCPVDCITMVPAERAWTDEDARTARIRHDARLARLQGTAPAAGCATVAASGSTIPPAAVSPGAVHDNTPTADADGDARKRAAIDNALARARARRGPPSP
jgi:electron transport complex protein RnfB